MLMTERRDPEEIVHLAATAVPALSSARALGAHLTSAEGARWHAGTDLLGQPAVRADLLTQMRRLPGLGGQVSIAGSSWAWAFGLLSPSESIGYLLVTADREPPSADLLLLRSLAQQTGIALANARLHASHRATNLQLTDMIVTLRNKTAIHDRFTQVALDGGGHQGVVEALCELTGRPASIEDRSGRVLASASPEGVAVPRATFSTRRDLVVTSALRAGRPLRFDDRLLTVVRPHPDVLGVLMISVPDETANDDESVALEHGATVLAIELARLHGLAETELRLGRNLVSDLVSGAVDGAFERAHALGHDLRRPHRVVVLGASRRAAASEDLLLHVREVMLGSMATSASNPPPLLMQRENSIVALVSHKASGSELMPALLQAAGRGARLGIGGLCRAPEDYSRSYREAQLALRLARETKEGPSVTRYDELGVYQLLSESADPRALNDFVDRWLGVLKEYDASHASELVRTLTVFLDSGGSYDATATELMLGRSTVRYRIRRIQQLTSHDLSDPDTRFQLQLAARAHSTMTAIAGGYLL
jgi:sugar diacid utilization regulator